MNLRMCLLQGGTAAALLLWAAGCETVDPVGEEAATEAAGSTTAQNADQTPVSRAPSSVSLGTRGDGGGFIWKPVSESDGRLVVLLPPQYRGRVQAAFIARGDGSVIEMGRFSGDDINGMRPHYRFSQVGAGYGRDIFLVADLSDGYTVHWPIPNGGSRASY